MNTLFLVAAIIEGVFGIGFVLAPGFMLDPFGVTLNDIATTLARLSGTALVTFTLLLWLARKSDSMEFKKGIIDCLLVYYPLSAVVLLMAQLAGQMNILGWSVIAIHVVLFIWFGYFLVVRLPAQQKKAGAT